MVATPDPLDQYLVTHPQYLFSQSPEHARIAPDNLGVLASHVACAAFELPFVSGEKLGNASIDDLLDALAEDGVVHASGGVKGLPLFKKNSLSEDEPAVPYPGSSRDEPPLPKGEGAVRYTWVGDTYPADRVGLRGAGDRVSIMDEMGNLVGDTERVTAASRVHPGAIYLHQAGAFLITEMDWDLGRAIGRKVDSDYYTQASAVSEVIVLKEFENKGDEKQPRSGEIEVTTTVGRFRQVQFNTHKVLGWGEIDLPAQHLLTVGYWFMIEPHIAKQLEKEGIIGLPNDYGPNWTKQRELARERDGYKCVVCGKPEPAGQQHHVHHRKPFRTFGYVRGENEHYLRANDLSNLMTVCPTCHAKIETAEQVNQALSSLCYLLGNLAPLFVMCDSSDIAATFDTASPHTRQPTITLYEMVPGGTGLTDELIVHHAELLQMAKDRIAECPCEQGCPACVGPIDEARGRNVKRDVMRLIELIQRG
jgi:DEAD/DEAH box helicase domain-containing protein